MKCIICDTTLKQRVTSWTYYCSNCDYWASSYCPSESEIHEGKSPDSDDVANISGLDNLRIHNFSIILKSINNLFNKGAKILDVGCATGIFLECAKKEGFSVFGVEPNLYLSNVAQKKISTTYNGFFPDILESNQLFDVIIFNDVFEHIPDLDRILEGCKLHLTEGGYLILNMPDSGGLLFKLAILAAKFNFYGPWKRLWQIMFYTPHTHYFSEKSINKLAAMHGFGSAISVNHLPSYDANQLWQRLSAGGAGFLLKLIAVPLLFILAPVLNNKKFTDIFYVIYKK